MKPKKSPPERANLNAICKMVASVALSVLRTDKRRIHTNSLVCKPDVTSDLQERVKQGICKSGWGNTKRYEGRTDLHPKKWFYLRIGLPPYGKVVRQDEKLFLIKLVTETRDVLRKERFTEPLLRTTLL